MAIEILLSLHATYNRGIIDADSQGDAESWLQIITTEIYEIDDGKSF